ncbi:MAG: NAD(P)-binding domain-containing protein [Edaphobacter sp.]
MNRNHVDVAILGAGPYGLSIAAHLRTHNNLSFRIFGTPMSSWRNHMASGTLLKSFGFASSLYDPGSTFTLEHFCRERSLIYSDVVDPVSIENFIAYGLEFQKRFVPQLEQTDITSFRHSSEGFTLTTETGETLTARRVVIAVGITYFGSLPPIFSNLPSDLVTHSSQHTDVSRFAGRSVAVIGAGASAADLAGLLQQAGADTHMIARRDSIPFHDPPEPEPRPLSQRLLMPRSGLGQGWPARLCSDLPLVFHALPEKVRIGAVHRVNGPAPGWFAKDKVVGHVTMHLGTTLQKASTNGSGVRLLLSQNNGATKELHVDHVIAATGYKVDLQRLVFLDPSLRSQMKAVDGAPVLDTNFQSSVPGIYLIGLAAATSFGPLCRFAYGAKFTSNRLSRHLASAAS